MSLRAVLYGAAAAVPTIGISMLLPKSVGYRFLSVLLGAIAGAYAGFALLDGRIRELSIEATAMMLFLVLTVLGLNSRPRFLVAAYFLHGLWDAAHRPAGVQTNVVSWYPAACWVYDWLVAGFILLWWRRASDVNPASP